MIIYNLKPSLFHTFHFWLKENICESSFSLLNFVEELNLLIIFCFDPFGAIVGFYLLPKKKKKIKNTFVLCYMDLDTVRVSVVGVSYCQTSLNTKYRITSTQKLGMGTRTRLEHVNMLYRV